ncbi:ABC transporter permease [Virgibacillus sp. C22-A2]|uniref:ABC transporter permease n=1 Tax=Virgibacillus tibetensis TaxID=3042313 RepID=A0ABU6KEM9_9BACI|nr:ABC transporter permease [Virgibacillus sp. C22-A2]
MLKRMLKKDLLKNKSITIILFIFISLSSILVASGVGMISDLTNSLNALFTKSNAPDFVQMHAGEINQAKIDQWSSKNELVKNVQAVEMINIDGTKIDFGNDGLIEHSIMDNYFVKQNKTFDYLLNLDSEILQVSEGEIAVPIYYMQQNDVKLGDTIRIMDQGFEMEFIVTSFVRDVQMNPSIIHSKRFVVNGADLEKLKKNIGELEYSIEFLLTDLNKLNEFRNMYESSELPSKGPAIDYPLLRTLNAITDGLVAAIIILVSFFLKIIAILCIRYTILAAIEEDYKEIGIMKAIGIPLRTIKRIYYIKYVVLALVATIIGYVASLFLNRLFTSNMMLYLGSAPKSIFLHITPLLGVVVVFLIILVFCILTFRRFNKVSTIEAMRSGSLGEGKANRRILSIHRWRIVNVNILLGIRDVFARFKMYILLFFVFLICSFIIIVPVNFLNTVQSSSFIKYMGIERSDLRIDLQKSENMQEEFNSMGDYLSNDNDVEKFSLLVTSRFKFINNEGAIENLTIETGDFTTFPLEYLEGVPPEQDNEIALSYLNSDEMGKGIGDHLSLIVQGQEKEMVITGIYQDVTNGGRTAKAVIPYNQETVLWYEVSLDLKSQSNLSDKINEYEEAFYPAKVTDLAGYLSQTFGNTIKQLQTFTIVAIAISLLVAALITSLFLRMLVAKDSAQIAIMKSIGFSLNNIRIQYITRSLLVLTIGIILGTVVSNTLGPSMVSILLSMMGASNIEFVINPIEAYILYPFIILSVVTVTTLLSIYSINKSSIVELNAE